MTVLDFGFISVLSTQVQVAVYQYSSNYYCITSDRNGLHSLSTLGSKSVHICREDKPTIAGS